MRTLHVCTAALMQLRDGKHETHVGTASIAQHPVLQ